MRLSDWEMTILREDGVERIGLEDVIVWEDEEHAEVLFPRPMIVRAGDLWVVTATFDED